MQPDAKKKKKIKYLAAIFLFVFPQLIRGFCYIRQNFSKNYSWYNLPGRQAVPAGGCNCLPYIDFSGKSIVLTKTICVCALACMTAGASAVYAAPEETAASFNTASAEAAQVRAEQNVSAPAQAGGQASQAGTAQSGQAAEPQRDENGFYPGCDVYVSLNNQVWTRSGPGTNYRITGAKPIGSKFTFVAYSRDKSFMQLEDENGKRFWMGTKTLQAEPCGPEYEQSLQQRITELEHTLANYDSELSRRYNALEQKSRKLEQDNKSMTEAIAQKDKTIGELDELRRDYEDRLQTRELDMQMRWWMQGAIIAFCGAIAGIIFMYLPRPGRKTRRERY